MPDLHYANTRHEGRLWSAVGTPVDCLATLAAETREDPTWQLEGDSDSSWAHDNIGWNHYKKSKWEKHLSQWSSLPIRKRPNMSEGIIKKCHINSKALRLVSMTWSIINWYCLLRRDSLVTACTVSWIKKILKDRIKPFAVAVEESLKQVAHMLSSSAWCLPEKGFYRSGFVTRIDLKWATTTVGKWCQFWPGRTWRGPAAESRVCLLKPSEIDSDTSLSKGQSLSGPAEKEKTWHCPGAEVTAQPAGQRCTDRVLSPRAQQVEQGMVSDCDGLRHSPGITRHVCVETGLGQVRKSPLVEGWAQTHLSSGMRPVLLRDPGKSALPVSALPIPMKGAKINIKNSAFPQMVICVFCLEKIWF